MISVRHAPDLGLAVHQDGKVKLAARVQPLAHVNLQRATSTNRVRRSSFDSMPAQVGKRTALQRRPEAPVCFVISLWPIIFSENMRTSVGLERESTQTRNEMRTS